MHYTFIEKAQQEADLQDVVKYLQEPLKTIEELFYKFPKLSIASKVDHTNQDLYQECERILNYHLPNLINNYCSFSMKYRNEHIIKTESKNGQTEKYTAKTLLLNDLAKIIEEINIIENKFNDINKMDFLVTNRMIAPLGQQPTFIAPEYETEKVALKNQFNYSIYSKETTEIPINELSLKQQNFISEPFLDNAVSDTVSQFTISFFKPKTQILLGICTSLIIAMIGGNFLSKNVSVKTTPQPVVVSTTVDSSYNHDYTRSNYKKYSRHNYDDYGYDIPPKPIDPIAVLSYNYNINIQLDLIKQKIHNKELQKKSFAINNNTIMNEDTTANNLKNNIATGYFNIMENTITKNNDSYKITLTNVPEAKCSEVASYSYNHYNTININNKNLSGLTIENSALSSITSHMCELQHNTIELINLK